MSRRKARRARQAAERKSADARAAEGASASGRRVTRSRLGVLGSLLVAPLLVTLVATDLGGAPASAGAAEAGGAANIDLGIDTEPLRPSTTGDRRVPKLVRAVSAPPPAAPIGIDASARESAPSIGPRASLETPVIELGHVDYRATVAEEIRVRNVGRETLTIIAARATCSCTAAEPDRRRVAPGETARIGITFEGRTLGQQERLVRVVTDDPVEPTLTVRVRATVRAPGDPRR